MNEALGKELPNIFTICGVLSGAVFCALHIVSHANVVTIHFTDDETEGERKLRSHYRHL